MYYTEHNCCFKNPMGIRKEEEWTQSAWRSGRHNACSSWFWSHTLALGGPVSTILFVVPHDLAPPSSPALSRSSPSLGTCSGPPTWRSFLPWSVAASLTYTSLSMPAHLCETFSCPSAQGSPPCPPAAPPPPSLSLWSLHMTWDREPRLRSHVVPPARASGWGLGPIDATWTERLIL